jgi:hypothetical protein
MTGAFMPNSKLADDHSSGIGQVELAPFLSIAAKQKDDSALFLDKEWLQARQSNVNKYTAANYGRYAILIP